MTLNLNSYLFGVRLKVYENPYKCCLRGRSRINADDESHLNDSGYRFDLGHQWIYSLQLVISAVYWPFSKGMELE